MHNIQASRRPNRVKRRNRTAVIAVTATQSNAMAVTATLSSLHRSLSHDNSSLMPTATHDCVDENHETAHLAQPNRAGAAPLRASIVAGTLAVVHVHAGHGNPHSTPPPPTPRRPPVNCETVPVWPEYRGSHAQRGLCTSSAVSTSGFVLCCRIYSASLHRMYTLAARFLPAFMLTLYRRLLTSPHRDPLIPSSPASS